MEGGGGEGEFKFELSLSRERASSDRCARAATCSVSL